MCACGQLATENPRGVWRRLDVELGEAGERDGVVYEELGRHG
jgi:hypothetical protein